MKISKILIAVGLLAALGFSGVVSAHTYSGTLGVAATATDRWYIVCSAGTASLTYQIQRTAGTAAHVKVGFDRTGIVSGPTTGARAVTALSPPKTAAVAGRVSYGVRAFCPDANGNLNPDDQSSVQTYIQNQ